MEQATLSIRLNKNDKIFFEEFCKSAGLNVSVAINMFVKAVIRTQRIPFEIEAFNTDRHAYLNKCLNLVKSELK